MRIPMIFTLSLLLFGNFALAEEGPTLEAGRFPDAASHVVVFRQNADGYNNVRIPAVCVSKAGTILAFAEGREAGDAGDIDLILRRSVDGGRTWGETILVWDDADNTCGNPTPVVEQLTGKIFLFCTWNIGADHENAIMNGTSREPRRAFVTASDDDGLTWSKPVEQPHLRRENWGWYATGPCNAVQLTRGPHKGRLVVPANHSVVSDTLTGPNRYRSHVVYSDDRGQTWHLGAVNEGLTNESTVAELSDGSLMQNMRSYHGKGCRAVTVSVDGGQTMGAVTLDEALVSPVCQGSLLRYRFAENESDDQSGVMLFSAPYGPARMQMSVWASPDDGKSWPSRKLIFNGHAAYSNLVALPDGRVGLLCELGNDNPYRTITFVTFPLTWLLDGN